MTRVVIDRIVIDAGWLDPLDGESFRERLQNELRALIEDGGLEQIESAARVDGGELPSSSTSASPRAVAAHVVRALGGES